MKLTSVIILAFGCWQLSSVLAYPAGTHPGERYHPWSNNPSLGTPSEPNDNVGRHLATGRPGTKDKGKGKAPSSQEPLERPLHPLMLPEDIPFSVDELLNAPYDFQYLPSTLWRPVEGNRPGHGLAEMESRPIAGHYPRSDEDVGQPMTPPSHVSNVSQSHHNDPRLQHLQWLGYQNVQYQQQPSGIQKVEGRTEGKVFRMLQLQDVTMISARSSWVASVVDNPFGPVEGRVYFSDPEQHAFVSQWANAERGKLAATSPTHDLRYMRLDENTQRWIMKREIVSGKEVVKAAPDDWWPSTVKSRVIVFKERVEKDTKKRRERREMQRQEASRGSGHSGRARSR
ncbi:hypothetical protein FA10DRAFT_258397 [Acaromyces ingoldii]|uniref:Uncharacterized protein n=1 Tax=Acaromyces ingoldii TaxID=215250 RepID=A0A316Z272_9BASI|nr:hypothetical protein FA10DRAFT_258397 [Acaromyces ingoldii]PWN94285.1 hypothetical protein FA10DRAFT_258397 [Acaromyces ingoldii]